jgi:hypothetical protein
VRKSLVASGIAVVAVFAGVIYFSRVHDAPPVARVAPEQERATPQAAPAPTAPPLKILSPNELPARPAVPADPRLRALMVSPDNGLIDFVAGPDGKVLKELDKDPNSPGYRKPLREYIYSGDRVVGLTAYKYLGDQVQVVRIGVSYKPDGSIDQYRESTSYDYGKKGQR